MDGLMDRPVDKLLRVQERIASRAVIEDSFSEGHVAGVDQAFIGEETVISGAVLLDGYMNLASASSAVARAALPYIPGLLSFREGTAAIRAVRGLSPQPSLLFVDGCGINHPRAAGLATYIGVTLDIPAVGISKGILCGSAESSGGDRCASPLIHDGRHVGYLMHSKRGCRPIVVAPGHRVSVQSSLDLAKDTSEAISSQSRAGLPTSTPGA